MRCLPLLYFHLEYRKGGSTGYVSGFDPEGCPSKGHKTTTTRVVLSWHEEGSIDVIKDLKSEIIDSPADSTGP